MSDSSKSHITQTSEKIFNVLTRVFSFILGGSAVFRHRRNHLRMFRYDKGDIHRSFGYDVSANQRVHQRTSDRKHRLLVFRLRHRRTRSQYS